MMKLWIQNLFNVLLKPANLMIVWASSVDLGRQLRLDRLRSGLLTILVMVPLMAVALLVPASVHADSATIFFTPSPASIGLADTSTVSVAVKSDVPIYSLDVTVSFPTSRVAVTGTTSEGCNFCTNVFLPQYDNAAGTVKFNVASTPPGYSGNQGVIGNIVFKGMSLGAGTLKVMSAHAIYAFGGHTNDSGGSKDVYAGSTDGQISVDNVSKPKYTVTGDKGPVPIVNSTSHPDPSKWYSNRNVSFTWTGGFEYDYTFDQSPDTIPPATSKGPSTSTTVSGVADGVWYFHVRATNEDGLWGPTSTFKVQIDGTNPAPFNLKLDPANDPSALPLISYQATDTPSGIDHYELSLDDGTAVTVPFTYQMPQVSPGKHTVTVKAFDLAGNSTTAKATLDLSPLSPAPTIDSPGDNYHIALGGGKLSGKGPKGATIQLYANGQYITSTSVSDKGTWELTLQDQPPAGKYTLKVKAVMPKHLDSGFSKEINGTIEAAGFSFGGVNIGGYKVGQFAVPAWALIIIYVVLLILLLLVLGYLFYRWQKARREEKLALQKLELMTETDVQTSPIPTDVGQSTAAPGPEPGVPGGTEPSTPAAAPGNGTPTTGG